VVSPQVPNSRFPEVDSEGDSEEEDENCPPEDEDSTDESGSDSDCDAAELEWEVNGELPEVKTDWECDGEPRVPLQRGATALHCFERVFSKEVLTLIVVETNRHARMLYARKRKDVKDWVDLTESELLKFLGHLMVTHAHAHSHHFKFITHSRIAHTYLQTLSIYFR
jgi:hypothetical protein